MQMFSWAAQFILCAHTFICYVVALQQHFFLFGFSNFLAIVWPHFVWTSPWRLNGFSQNLIKIAGAIRH